MRAIKNKLFFLINIMIFLNSFNNYYLAQAKQNSLIKLFCINSIKEEMLNAEIEYSEEIANETCECYYEEFIKTSSHKDAKTKCKLETQESIKS